MWNFRWLYETGVSGYPESTSYMRHLSLDVPPQLSAGVRRLRLLWLLAVFAVVTGSLLPATSSPVRALHSLHLADWAEHCCAYACLAFLPALHERWRVTLVFSAGSVALGILLELGQWLSRYRVCELSDIVADTAGVCLGLAIGWRVRFLPLVRSLLSLPTR